MIYVLIGCHVLCLSQRVISDLYMWEEMKVLDRKSVVLGKSVSGLVDGGGGVECVNTKY